MSGFFVATDTPARRVVQYKRVSGHSEGAAVFIDDESVLGAALDVMPFADKTGLSPTAVGTLFEVPYLADAGDVYISTQPKDAEPGTDLKLTAKGGTKPYTYQWYKDDKQVVNVPHTDNKLTAVDSGSYFCVVTDASGGQAFSQAVKVEAKATE